MKNKNIRAGSNWELEVIGNILEEQSSGGKK